MADIKGKLKNDLKNMPYIRQFLHEYFDLGKDKDNEAVTVESIRNGVEFKGTNLCDICHFHCFFGAECQFYGGNHRRHVDISFDGSYHGSGIGYRAE